jgi:2-dehydro-3-deoxyglucarate aldolase/4-hydroxy-2-oxoheptanedioate aldolase
VTEVGVGVGTFRERIRAGEALVGTFINLGSPVSIEICALAGFDWLLIDLEHGSGSQADLLGQLLAVARTGTPPVVRVELPARTPVSRALDPGAGGIMFPRIERASEAAEAVRYLRFPPDGVRGVAVQNRTGRFGQVSIADLAALDDAIVGMVQIETLGALAELRAIAAVDGVDVLFVGPGDLSYALGCPGRLDDPRYQDALRSVLDACAAEGCAPGILVPNAAEARRHLELGFRVIAVGSDGAFVMNAARAVVEDFRVAARPGGA